MQDERVLFVFVPSTLNAKRSLYSDLLYSELETMFHLPVARLSPGSGRTGYTQPTSEELTKRVKDADEDFSTSSGSGGDPSHSTGLPIGAVVGMAIDGIFALVMIIGVLAWSLDWLPRLREKLRPREAANLVEPVGGPEQNNVNDPGAPVTGSNPPQSHAF